MKRRLFSILALMLIVGVVAVTTPCDCKAVSEAINSVSPAQQETCPFCAKHNRPVVKPVLDQRTVLVNPTTLHLQPVLVLPSSRVSCVEAVSHISLLPIAVQYSPPSFPPLNLRI
jgi:hypothetical protein